MRARRLISLVVCLVAASLASELRAQENGSSREAGTPGAPISQPAPKPAPTSGDTHRRWRVVRVPAFAGGDLFHYSGDFTSHIAIRNAYAETVNLGLDGLS